MITVTCLFSSFSWYLFQMFVIGTWFSHWISTPVLILTISLHCFGILFIWSYHTIFSKDCLKYDTKKEATTRSSLSWAFQRRIREIVTTYSRSRIGPYYVSCVSVVVRVVNTQELNLTDSSLIRKPLPPSSRSVSVKPQKSGIAEVNGTFSQSRLKINLFLGAYFRWTS